MLYAIRKWKESSFSGRNPKFPCSTVALSKVLLSKVHSTWWTLTMIFSTCKVDVSFLWIGAYVKLIDNSSGINNAVDILNNSPWLESKGNLPPTRDRFPGFLNHYNQPRFDCAFKKFVSCSAGEDESLNNLPRVWWFIIERSPGGLCTPQWIQMASVLYGQFRDGVPCCQFVVANPWWLYKMGQIVRIKCIYLYLCSICPSIPLPI